tara:strand:- start:324 stop:497 length:174 start_codon:yes stop_codon:yes gene_type:complete
MTWKDLEEKYLSKGENLDEQLRQNSFEKIRSIKINSCSKYSIGNLNLVITKRVQKNF